VNRRSSADDEKTARLAAALRENLKRRKAQARARQADEATAEEPMPQAQADPSRS
jgi:UDP:flavonoid glycosyltransferase YjiC (YdhE family)